MNMASDVTRVRASRVWLSAVAIALLLVVSNTAPATAQSTATVMVSNLDEAEERRIWLNPGQAYAHSFHTGNTAVTLEKVRLYLRGAESTPAVTIRADNSGQPYRSLQALTNPSIDSLISTHEDFTAAGYVLAANTTYWVVFHRQWGSKPFSFSPNPPKGACERPPEEVKGCTFESEIMVLNQKTCHRKGAPNRCYHVTTLTASKSPSTIPAW